MLLTLEEGLQAAHIRTRTVLTLLGGVLALLDLARELCVYCGSMFCDVTRWTTLHTKSRNTLNTTRESPSPCGRRDGAATPG